MTIRFPRMRHPLPASTTQRQHSIGKLEQVILHKLPLFKDMQVQSIPKPHKIFRAPVCKRLPLRNAILLPQLL